MTTATAKPEQFYQGGLHVPVAVLTPSPAAEGGPSLSTNQESHPPMSCFENLRHLRSKRPPRKCYEPHTLLDMLLDSDAGAPARGGVHGSL